MISIITITSSNNNIIIEMKYQKIFSLTSKLVGSIFNFKLKAASFYLRLLKIDIIVYDIPILQFYNLI